MVVLRDLIWRCVTFVEFVKWHASRNYRASRLFAFAVPVWRLDCKKNLERTELTTVRVVCTRIKLCCCCTPNRDTWGRRGANVLWHDYINGRRPIRGGFLAGGSETERRAAAPARPRRLSPCATREKKRKTEERRKTRVHYRQLLSRSRDRENPVLSPKRRFLRVRDWLEEIGASPVEILRKTLSTRLPRRCWKRTLSNRTPSIASRHVVRQ